VLLNIYGCNLKLPEYLNGIRRDDGDYLRDIGGAGEIEIANVSLFWERKK